MPKSMRQKLEDIDFFAMEQFIAELYILQGCFVQVTSKTGDGKKDIIALKNSPDEEYTKFIESKRYDSKNYLHPNMIKGIAHQVNKDAKRYGLKQDEYEIVIVTTSNLRLNATDKVLNQHNIKYISGETFAKRIMKYKLKYAVDLYYNDLYDVSNKESIMKRFDSQNIYYTDKQVEYIENSNYTLRLVVYTEQNHRDITNNSLIRENRIQKYKEKFEL